MCMFERNTVIDTRADRASGDPTRRGFGVLASFYSEAALWQNRLAANPVPAGAVTSSVLRTTSRPGW
jgi:hypothetical protein